MTRRIAAALLLATLPRLTPAQPASRDPGVSLVVLIAVDQMRGDYFDRWRGQLTGGLASLRARGAFFPNGAQDHALTETAPGHATMLSGRFPAHTRIWSNDEGVEDPGAPLVGGPARDGDGVPLGASPRRFVGTTLVDWLRARDPRARALSVSRKDRAAILPVGRARADVYWFAGGRFTTSAYYADTLPAWLRRWNAGLTPSAWAGREWRPLLADSAYAEPDDRAWENGGRDVTFPHRLPADADDAAELWERLERAPWMDSLTLSVALAGVRATGLGQRDGGGAPDVLSVSLSTTDAIGHDFGPDSRELHDHVLRLDRWLGAFLDSLAALVPRERTLLALTADHGVSPMPERLRADGKAAGRVDLTGLADSTAAALRARWGVDFRLAFDNGLLAADVDAMRARGVDVDSLAEALARSAAGRPGVRRALTPQALGALRLSDPDAGRWRRSLPNGLGWLLAGVAEAGWVFSDSRKAEHGTMHAESRHVPLLFVGPGVAPRVDPRPVRTVDLAPTLAALLGVRPTERVDGVAILGAGRSARGTGVGR